MKFYKSCIFQNEESIQRFFDTLPIKGRLFRITCYHVMTPHREPFVLGEAFEKIFVLYHSPNELPKRADRERAAKLEQALEKYKENI